MEKNQEVLTRPTFTIVGIGYVGLSNAILLAQHNKVYAVDIDKEKIEALNRGESLIEDKEIKEYLKQRRLYLTATADAVLAYKESDFVVIATPTNYDPVRNYFDTSSVEKVIEEVSAVNKHAVIIIKSTVPVGYTEGIRKKYNTTNIIFCPEFLREGHALYDNLYPSRIIAGVPEEDEEINRKAGLYVNLLQEGAVKKDIPTLIINPTEAEAVKLFANTYLALRVCFFNELDT